LYLINDILDLSKIEAGQLTIGKAPFELNGLIEDIRKIFKHTAQEKRLELVVDLDPSLPQYVLGDAQRLRQVLINIVGNAVKFTKNGNIKISVESPASGQISFTVEDTGIGMTADVIGKIFTPFQQGDTSITRRFGGTGLGLTICQRLVDAMGGQLQCKSELSKGSHFYFTIPLKQVEEVEQTNIVKLTRNTNSEIRQNREKTESEKGQCSYRILLAEDSEENVLVVQAYLNNTLYQLVTVRNGAKAVEMFMSDHFDLVLMDIQMPIMDGLSATREIRAWEKREGRLNVPIIALTANAMKENIEESREAGCNFHLTKPVRKRRLLDVIEQHIGCLEPSL
jgi:two-component system, sensor histidine kinase